jgi:carbonic anhydrase
MQDKNVEHKRNRRYTIAIPARELPGFAEGGSSSINVGVVMGKGMVKGGFVKETSGRLPVADSCCGADPAPDGSADSALRILIEGNGRFVSEKMKHSRQSMEWRAEAAKGQHPVTVVLSCSDSRVPPEIIFDQGLGDLFVVRTAGEVVREVELGSIEYAVEHLHTPLIVVLGHKRCGAVEAAVKGGHAPGNIASLVELIRPSVEEAKKQKGDVVDNAVRINVRMVAEKIKGSEIIARFVKEKGVRIAQAYYDLDDGTVTIMEAGKQDLS